MKTHQRYFTTRTKNNAFAPYFVFVTNLPGEGEDIVSGNEKVLSARLADAAYFYNQDQKTPLESRLEKLKEVVFHAKLGSLYDKTLRLVKITQYLKPNDADLANASRLCKCDLVTEAVSEFPELQGIMGSYYAELEGASKATSLAIRNHYLPLGNNDDVPTGHAAFLALADKMDSLVSLMQAGERATGSKDPYALRRYALGIIKIILQNKMEDIHLKDFISNITPDNDIQNEVLKFIEERLKYSLKDEYDLGAINAAIDLSIENDLSVVAKKVKAIDNFMRGERGSILLQLYKRVTNILGATKITSHVDASKFTTDEERNLYDTIKAVEPTVIARLDSKDFEHALDALNSLGESIAQFFDKVLVNDADPIVAENRRGLLLSISNIFNQIAKFEQL